jgi:hypothetical protein
VEDGVLLPEGGSYVGPNSVIFRKLHSSERAPAAVGTVSIRAPYYSFAAKYLNGTCTMSYIFRE